MKEKKDLAIVFGVTFDFAFALSNVLIGLKNFLKEFPEDIIVFHSGLSLNDKAKLNSIMPCKFIDYTFPYENIQIGEYCLKHFSLISFCKFECFKLLNEYKKILWLDVDILIKGDFSELFHLDNYNAAFAKDCISIRENFLSEIEGYNLESENYFTGTFILSDSIKNYEIMTDWCYKKTIELSSVLKYGDQGIINLLIQVFNINIKEFSSKIYICHPLHENLLPNAKIIHSYSPEKFWNFYNFKDWNNNYKSWLKMGGSRYSGKKMNFIQKIWHNYFPGAPSIIKQPKRFYLYLINIKFPKK